MGTAETKAKRKYNNKAYDRLFVSVKKGKKEIYRDAAASYGFSSLNSWIESILDREVEKAK